MARQLETPQGEERNQVADVQAVGRRIEAGIERDGPFGQPPRQAVSVGAVSVETSPRQFAENIWGHAAPIIASAPTGCQLPPTRGA